MYFYQRVYLRTSQSKLQDIIQIKTRKYLSDRIPYKHKLPLLFIARDLSERNNKFQENLGQIKLLVLTLVNIAQGVAEARLISQIRRIILLAFPMVEREREESGRHMARYLRGDESSKDIMRRLYC